MAWESWKLNNKSWGILFLWRLEKSKGCSVIEADSSSKKNEEYFSKAIKQVGINSDELIACMTEILAMLILLPNQIDKKNPTFPMNY